MKFLKGFFFLKFIPEFIGFRAKHEENKEERGSLCSSLNERKDLPEESKTCLISQHQDVIISRLEKILEEREQAGDSGEHSPSRVRLTALDNS